MASSRERLSRDEVAVWRALMVFWRLGLPRLDRTFRKHGLIHLEYGILAVLSDTPDHSMPAGELAELSGLSTSHLSHRLKAMERDSLVVRSHGSRDRRQVLVRMTEAGLKRYAEATPEHVSDVKALMFSSLTPSETATLAAILTKVTAPLTSHPFAGGSARPERTPSDDTHT